MEFVIAQLIKAVFFPPGIFVVLIVISLRLSNVVAAKRLLIFTAVAIYALSMPLVSQSLITPLEKYKALDFKVAQDIPAEAIVILSAGRWKSAAEYGGNDMSGDNTLGRLMYGARLHIATQLPILVTGGLREEGQIPLGELMARDLFDNFGIKANWQENESSNTAENAQFSFELLSKERKNHIFLVTDAWHMTRAVSIFENQGFIVTPAPTRFLGNEHFGENFKFDDLLPNMHALHTSFFAIHEGVGGLWYSLRY